MKLIKTWQQVKDIKGAQAIEITFKDEAGVKYKGLIKATNANIDLAWDIKEVEIEGEFKTNTFSNKYGTFTNMLLSPTQLKEIGFEVITQKDLMKQQITNK